MQSGPRQFDPGGFGGSSMSAMEVVDAQAANGGTLLRSSEDDIAWWHGTDEGFAGRKPLADLPMEGSGPIS